MTIRAKLAMCNIFPDVRELRAFAVENRFKGIEWSFSLDEIPETPSDQSSWVTEQGVFAPMEVRYHCPFYQTDLGHDDPVEAKAAGILFQKIIRLVSKAGGRYLTIHIGLGRDTTEPLSWEATVDNLRRLVHYGLQHQVTVCLENLAWGWTSRPNLFEKLIRRSGAGVTFDVGHAYVCESVVSHQYSLEDFITPHIGRVFNAHLYHKEVSGVGHLPPERIEDMESRLSLLVDIGCPWWVVELHEADALLQTMKVIEAYLSENHSYSS